MPVLKLTQEGIGKLRCPDDKRSLQVCCKQHRGLLLELRKTSPDRPTWYVRYKDQSKSTRYVRLGYFPDLSLADARARAKDVQAEIRLGADPRAEEDAKKAVPTFSEFFEEQYMPYARTRKRTAAKDEEYYRLRLKAAFGNKRLDIITRRGITLFYSNLLNQDLAPATCNHYLKLLKRTLNLAIEWDIFPGPNPARGIRQAAEMNIVNNFLDSQQLQRLLSVLQTDKNRTVCNIILFLLSTGARLSEALNAKWEHIDLERRIWRIPATNSKSFKTRNVQLGTSAIDVLSLQTTKGVHDYIFINKKTEKPYTTIQKVWQRLRNKAGIPHYRIHDTRHQHASLLLANGTNLAVVQKVLGHSSPIVTNRYAHLADNQLREAADSVSDILKEAMLKKAS